RPAKRSGGSSPGQGRLLPDRGSSDRRDDPDNGGVVEILPHAGRSDARRATAGRTYARGAARGGTERGGNRRSRGRQRPNAWPAGRNSLRSAAVDFGYSQD